MIHINLLGEKEDYSFEYLLQLIVFGVFVILIVGSCFFANSHFSDHLAELGNEKSVLTVRLAKLDKITSRVSSLEKDKKLLKEKLKTIARLKAKKHGPVHIIEDLNKAIPERAWLTAVKEKSGVLEVKGVALDNQTIATFMHDLEGSPYFDSVELVHSKRYVKKKVKLKEFRLFFDLLDPLKVKEDIRKALEKKAKSEQAQKAAEA